MKNQHRRVTLSQLQAVAKQQANSGQLQYIAIKWATAWKQQLQHNWRLAAYLSIEERQPIEIDHNHAEYGVLDEDARGDAVIDGFENLH